MTLPNLNGIMKIFYIVAFLIGFIGFSIQACGGNAINSNTELRTKIAIIDTGIDTTKVPIAPFLCKDGHQDFTNDEKGVLDRHGHGSNIAWLITRNLNPKTHCLVILKYYATTALSQNGSSNGLRIIQALRAAVKAQVSYINLSGGGAGNNLDERDAVLSALSKDIRVVVAAGNNGSDLGKKCDFFPACYKNDSPNFYAIGNCIYGNYASSSNYGGPVKVCRNGMRKGPEGLQMSGTSQATAIYMNELVLKESK